MPKTLTYYYSSGGELSDGFIESIVDLCKSNDILFIDQSIERDIELNTRYSSKTPLVVVGPYQLNWPFSIKEVEIAINASRDLEIDNIPRSISQQKIIFTNKDRFALWVSKSYVWVISLLIFLFTTVPLIAPWLSLSNRQDQAKRIYAFYSILCHQLAYRSFFLGGIQPFYPRELAGVNVEFSYEEVTGKDPTDLDFARNFTGDDYLGYKVAICQRDLAIYGSLSLFGLLFQLTGKKIKSLHWFLWLIIALFPIALDGFSQLPALTMGLPAWLPIRESTPILRIITGTLFGVGTAWYMFPLMEESMKETRFQLSRKRLIVQKISSRA